MEVSRPNPIDVSDGAVHKISNNVFAEVVATPGRPMALRVTDSLGYGVLVRGRDELLRLCDLTDKMVIEINREGDWVNE